MEHLNNTVLASFIEIIDSTVRGVVY